MVEMIEVANILNNATNRSLLILEEEASIPGWLSEGGASGKCLSVTFVNLTMTRSRNMTMKNVGMSFAGCPPVTL